MKTVRVAAAVIQALDQDGVPVIFATQRGYGPYKHWWEFPGGKIEENETPQETVVREIREELDAVVEVSQYGVSVEYDYPDFHLTMHCYWCKLLSREVKLLEHEAAKWLPVDENLLGAVDWLPADLDVIKTLMDQR